MPQRFPRGFLRWERLLYRSTAVVLGLLVIGQLLMLNDRVRYRLSRVEPLEGSPYQEQQSAE